MSNSPTMDDVKLSAEWCATEAARCDRNALSLARTPSAGVMPRGGYSPTSRHAEKERLKAQALRIASRVLDPGAEEEVARVICEEVGDDFPNEYAREAYLEQARAVLAWMRGEM